jgi:O-antigen biosynthesis protein WbqV
MGQPVRIVELAERMIRLSGLEPGRDVDIAFTGLRPGERLEEILFAREEPTSEIGIGGIVAAQPARPSLAQMKEWLAALNEGVARNDYEIIHRVLRRAVPDFGRPLADRQGRRAEGQSDG